MIIHPQYPFLVFIFLVALEVNLDELDAVVCLKIGVNNPDSRLRAAPLEGFAGEFFGLENFGFGKREAGNMENPAVVDSQIVIGVQLEADESF